MRTLLTTLLATLLLAVTLFAWGRSSGTTQAVSDGITLGATGANVECLATSASTPTCMVNGADTFQLTINAASIPADGYESFGMHLYAAVCHHEVCAAHETLTYIPRADCMDETVWPDVGDCWGGGTWGDRAIHAATYAGSLPMPTSYFVGALVELDVSCSRLGLFEVGIDNGFYYQAVLSDGVTDLVRVGSEIVNTLIIDCLAASDQPPPTDDVQPTPSASVEVLDFDTFPGGDWQFVSDGDGTSYVSGGVLTINSPTTPYEEFSPSAINEFQLRHPNGLWHQEASNSRGWVIEARLRVDPSSGERCSDDLKIWAYDHISLVQVGFGTDEICLLSPDRVYT